ncbi:MAG: hypothetical protein E7678_05285 [Ruminococcaceae bacterium]|nr:hypothetical protein [Oscillospiraceae bacterium]
MNIKERFIEEVNKFENATQKSISSSVGRWLNVAYKLDYISLAYKERIEELLKRKDESTLTEEDLADITFIAEIASNTRFSEGQLKSIAYI